MTVVAVVIVEVANVLVIVVEVGSPFRQSNMSPSGHSPVSSYGTQSMDGKIMHGPDVYWHESHSLGASVVGASVKSSITRMLRTVLDAKLLRKVTESDGAVYASTLYEFAGSRRASAASLKPIDTRPSFAVSMLSEKSRMLMLLFGCVKMNATRMTTVPTASEVR